jgi:N-acetylmuramoyl-L-alanine amidase
MARPLKMFMRGKSVRTLQELLKRLGYPMDDQPGIFGASTRDAVKNFQSQKDLKATGIVDDELISLMRQGHNVSDIEAIAKPNAARKSAPSPQSVDEQKLDALIRLLISKEIISEEELQAEMKRVPSKKAAALPLR